MSAWPRPRPVHFPGLYARASVFFSQRVGCPFPVARAAEHHHPVPNSSGALDLHQTDGSDAGCPPQHDLSQLYCVIPAFDSLWLALVYLSILIPSCLWILLSLSLWPTALTHPTTRINTGSGALTERDWLPVSLVPPCPACSCRKNQPSLLHQDLHFTMMATRLVAMSPERCLSLPSACWWPLSLPASCEVPLHKVCEARPRTISV